MVLWPSLSRFHYNLDLSYSTRMGLVFRGWKSRLVTQKEISSTIDVHLLSSRHTCDVSSGPCDSHKKHMFEVYRIKETQSYSEIIYAVSNLSFVARCIWGDTHGTLHVTSWQTCLYGTPRGLLCVVLVML